MNAALETGKREIKGNQWNHGVPVLVNYTPQGITFHCRNWGQERLLIVATVWCLFLFQWMAKLWPEGSFMKVGRLVFTAILRTKCNLTGSGVSSRILWSYLSQSHYFLSQLHTQQFLQVQGTLWAVSVFFLAQPSCLPTSWLLWYPLKGKNHSASSIACSAWSEVSEHLGKPWFILRATGQSSPLGKGALGCRESVACPGHFLLNLSAGRKMSTDLGRFCSPGKSLSSLCMPQGIPALCQWGAA